MTVSSPQIDLTPTGGILDVAQMETILQDALDDLLPRAAAASEDQTLAISRDDLFVTPFALGAVVAQIKRGLTQDVNFALSGTQAYAATMPGLVPLHYAATVEGPPSVLEPLDPSNVAATDRGPVLRIFGAGVVSRRQPAVLLPGRKWLATAIIRRSIDSADPLGDALRVTVAWLNADQTQAGLSVTETVLNAGAVDITSAQGWVTVAAVISADDLSGVDHFNTQAKFARVVVEQFGTGERPVADVLWLDLVDITNNAVVTDTAADAEARLTALESATPFASAVQPSGADLDALTAPGYYAVTSPVNGPTGAAATVGVEVAQVDAQTARQEIWDAAGNNAARFWRHRIGGTWGAWQQFAARGYVDTKIAELANSVSPGTRGEFLPTITAPGATGLVVTYGAARAARYVWSADGLVHVYGTVAFSVDYTAGDVPILIGGLPVAADTTTGIFEALAQVKPAGNWVYSTNHKATIGRIDGATPTEIVIGFEATDTGLPSERRNYALSQVPKNTELALSFSVTYAAVQA